MQRLQLYKGIAIFVGTVIGAGVLGIPWAVGKSGFLAGLLHILALGLAMMFVNLCVGELTLRTQGDHQLAGYAGLYLGKWGKRLMMLSLMIGIYGALIAYTVGIGQSAAQIFGLEPWLWSALFYILGIILVSLDIKRIGLPEMFLSLTKLGLLITIFIVISASGLIQSENLTKFVTPEFLAPYGVVLFAYLGMSAVPEVREVMLGSWQLMKNAIIIGSLIPIILYALFTFAVVGSLGSNISEVATISIGSILGRAGIMLINAFAIFAMFSAFVPVSIALRHAYSHDFGLRKPLALLLVFSAPVLLILAGVHSFARTLEVAGALAGGIGGTLIILMWLKAKTVGERKPEYSLELPIFFAYLLIAMFILGAGYVIYSIV